MGLLDKIAVVQEDYRDLLHEPGKAGGPTLEEQTSAQWRDDYDEESIVNMATSIQLGSRLDIFSNNQSLCLSEAIAILDHLSTLGMEVRFKSDNSKRIHGPTGS